MLECETTGDENVFMIGSFIPGMAYGGILIKGALNCFQFFNVIEIAPLQLNSYASTTRDPKLPPSKILLGLFEIRYSDIKFSIEVPYTLTSNAIMIV